MNPKFCIECGEKNGKHKEGCRDFEINYCEFCGEELFDEDVEWGEGGTHDEIITVGYKCHNCKEKTEF